MVGIYERPSFEVQAVNHQIRAGDFQLRTAAEDDAAGRRGAERNRHGGRSDAGEVDILVRPIAVGHDERVTRLGTGHGSCNATGI